MSDHQKTIIGSSVVPFRLLFLMWLAFTVEHLYGFNIGVFGIHPLQPIGLLGILMAPLLHVNLTHLLSNTFTFLFLGVVLFYFYNPIARKVFFRCYVLTGALVWLFGRPMNHVGASGLIYALAFFLIFFGVFRRDRTSMLISIVIILIYGGLFNGLFPDQPNISWESHLCGALVGVFHAVAFSRQKLVY